MDSVTLGSQQDNTQRARQAASQFMSAIENKSLDFETLIWELPTPSLRARELSEKEQEGRSETQDHTRGKMDTSGATRGKGTHDPSGSPDGQNKEGGEGKHEQSQTEPGDPDCSPVSAET